MASGGAAPHTISAAAAPDQRASPTVNSPSFRSSAGSPGSSASPRTPRSSGASDPATASSGNEPSEQCTGGRCYAVGPVYELPAGVAPESSGIVASSKSSGVFFVVDDGTGVNRINAIRANGSLVARIRVEGMDSQNAEALSAGPCESSGQRCLYIGDIGDNNARRKHITVYRLAEPAVAPAPKSPVAADVWQYTYPDGPHNAESLVVAPDGSLLIITKSAPDDSTGAVPPHRIYRGKSGGGMLQFISSFTPPNPEHRLQSLFTGTVVTDANYSQGRMLLLTYDEVIEYRAPEPNSDPATFPSWPHRQLLAPEMIQSEGITADPSGCGYEVTSEEGPGGSRATIAGVTCR
jgi:hypothetical protein